MPIITCELEYGMFDKAEKLMGSAGITITVEDFMVELLKRWVELQEAEKRRGK